MSKSPELTPMMRQYLEIKEKHRDAILFFRLGDFYEMFFEDAVEASKILGITLTTRNRHDKNPVPLCGIPHHSASSYISKLLENGRKVAICEQTEDPKTAKGVVKREVTKVVTPGLVVDEGNLKSNESNYLASLTRQNDVWGLAYLDLSTGDFRVTEVNCGSGEAIAGIEDELIKILPRELIISESVSDEPALLKSSVIDGCTLTVLERRYFDAEEGERKILGQFDLHSLDGLGCQKMSAGIGSAGAVLTYLDETQGIGGHIDRLKPYSCSSFMILDAATRRNLELTHSMTGENKIGSLYQVLDHTETAMGARKLRDWINFPLQDSSDINSRLDAVSELRERSSLRREIRERLGGIYDVERLNGRVALGRANPKDLVALADSLREIPHVKELVGETASALLKNIADGIDPLPDLEKVISDSIEDDSPANIKEGGIIRPGYSDELDELREISREGKGYLAKLEAKERQRTGISSLKVRFNKVFGYYIEVTKANLHLVPEDYLRKQTLANAERFITPELKEYESKILGADERILQMEYDLFVKVREKAARYSGRLRDTADRLSDLDAVVSLAEAADKYGYARPAVDDSDRLHIREGRHPVVERISPEGPFVPNDADLDCETKQLAIITGPNMAGKSTYIRQVALIALMAHMGSFVPAEEANVGLVDRIFTRVGASDNLSKGQSTFMVEMSETANILNNATPKSLIILDEIGRGTSTFDGVSIAWAVAEYIHDSNRMGAKALFATHYHELTELALTKNRVKNYNVAVREWNGRIIFLRKIVEGGASRSYGIEVARLAGLPYEVIERSLEILNNLEKGEFDESRMPRLALPKRIGPGAVQNQDETRQMNLFTHPAGHIVEEIKNIDIAAMTPLEALNRLSRFKEELD